MAELHDLTALELAEGIRRREISPVEVTEHYLDRISRWSDRYGAYVTVTADLARAQAHEAEQAVLRAADPGELPPLHGVPVPVKDLTNVAGVPCRLGSAAFVDFVPHFDDHVVTRIRASGAVLLGKTNTPEFGLSCYTESDVAPPA
ncbi:amidase, partial [Carbonactinospora thermoautotrophica]